MCYGLGCAYENRQGECTKRHGLPCPMNEKQMDKYEHEVDLRCRERQAREYFKQSGNILD